MMSVLGRHAGKWLGVCGAGGNGFIIYQWSWLECLVVLAAEAVRCLLYASVPPSSSFSLSIAERSGSR
jgi:hypothetical protein